MNKIQVEKVVFSSQKSSPFTWKDIKNIPFEEDDTIHSHYVEPYYSENESWDGHYRCEVTRLVEETDEQYEKRVERMVKLLKKSKQERYEQYLKLKEEFENL